MAEYPQLADQAEVEAVTPTNLFKCVPSQFVPNVLRGELLFRNLAYFKQVEDGARGDVSEGMHIDKPDNLVTVRSLDGKVNIAGNFAFHNEVNQKRVFAFCLSSVLSRELMQEFQSDAVIEIFEVERFLVRVRRAIRKLPSLTKAGLIASEVEYYRANEPAKSDVKDPRRIPFFKPICFTAQSEYRLVCAQKGGLQLREATVNERHSLKEEADALHAGEKLIRMGSLEGIARETTCDPA